MQYSKLSALATLAVATLAAATPAPNGGGSAPSNQCNTGSAQCCNSTQQASSASSSLLGLLTLLGIPIQSVSGLIGVTCSPITAIGAGGTSCSAQPVCCTNNSFNGVVALGFTPVNVNL